MLGSMNIVVNGAYMVERVMPSLSEVQSLAAQSVGDPEASKQFQQTLGYTPEAFVELPELVQKMRLGELQAEGGRTMRTDELNGLAFDWAVAFAQNSTITGTYRYRDLDGSGNDEISIKVRGALFSPSRNPRLSEIVASRVGVPLHDFLQTKLGETVFVPSYIVQLHDEQLAIDARVARGARLDSGDPALFGQGLKIPVASGEQASQVQQALFALGCGFHNGRLPLDQNVELGNSVLTGIHVTKKGVLSLSFQSDQDWFAKSEDALVPAEVVIKSSSLEDLNAHLRSAGAERSSPQAARDDSPTPAGM